MNIKRTITKIAFTVAFTLIAGLPSVGAQDADGPRQVAMGRDGIILSKEGEIITRDNVQLSATFYPGYGDKDTIPVLMLHGQDGSRQDFDSLVDELGPLGYAMLIPDLRGHGKSTTKMVMNRAGQRSEIEIDGKRLKPADYSAMKSIDMSALRKFLVKLNNAGKLNLNKLVVVGAGIGGSAALDWAIYDWSVTNVPRIGLKQGKSVKVLVLLSPELKSPGFNTLDAIRHPIFTQVLPVMIVAGKKDRSSFSCAERISKSMDMHIDDREPPKSREEAFGYRVVLGKYDTDNVGTKLLDNLDYNLPADIGAFIDMKVGHVESPQVEWLPHDVENKNK